MLIRDQIVHNFTPPTCTLSLWARRSPLLLQRSKPLASFGDEYRFELSFDDPRLPEDRQALVKGTAKELRELSGIVNRYVQELLAQSLAETDTTEQPKPITPIQYAPMDSLSLHGLGVLRHQFCFGRLESPTHANPLLELSTSQLFDLAQVMGDFDHQLITPASSYSALRRKPLLTWSAVVLVSLAAITLTRFGLEKFQGNSSSLEGLSGQVPQPNRFSLTEVLPPAPPAPVQGPFPQPSLAPNLAKPGLLPPPSAVGTAVPPQRNPTVAVVVPPSRPLPPPPVVPPAPDNTLFVIPPPNPATASRPDPTAIVPQAKLPILPPQGVADISPTNFQGQTIPPAPQLPALNHSFNQSPASSPSGVAPTGQDQNLLDTIPQVAEVRKYYQRSWQPPEDLQQTLEYRLAINTNGALKQTTPLGKAASLYLARLPQPSPQTPFVSPLSIKGDQVIRLVLSPNGSVRTFLED